MQVTLTVTYTDGERTISAHPSHELAVVALTALANVAQTARIKRVELAFDVPNREP
jgi:uncharacterized protein YqiB (DUF1249 family)